MFNVINFIIFLQRNNANHLKNLADKMKEYTSSKQISIEEFVHRSFGCKLNPENRWVKLANLLQLDKMV